MENRGNEGKIYMHGSKTIKFDRKLNYMVSKSLKRRFWW